MYFQIIFSQFMGLLTLGLNFIIFSGNYQQKEKEGMTEIYIYIYIYIYLVFAFALFCAIYQN